MTTLHEIYTQQYLGLVDRLDVHAKVDPSSWEPCYLGDRYLRIHHWDDRFSCWSADCILHADHLLVVDLLTEAVVYQAAGLMDLRGWLELDDAHLD
jgi:hypothetical protein